jgi:hypothetical protein
MFTLRDQVFPNESGSAAAVSRPAYEQAVGRICDELNDDDRRRALEANTIRKKLPRAKTTLAQRNLLLDGQRRTIARSGHALASFTALVAPHDLLAARRTTVAAWSLNLGRGSGHGGGLATPGAGNADPGPAYSSPPGNAGTGGSMGGGGNDGG